MDKETELRLLSEGLRRAVEAKQAFITPDQKAILKKSDVDAEALPLQERTFEEAAEKDCVLICMVYRKGEPMIKPDNVLGLCGHCGTGLQFRPEVPKTLTKICAACAVDMMTEEANGLAGD